ncbi:hypothetical protein ACTNBM_02935 [Lachnospiraceae bacterium HCP1S3_C3]|nr:hypothetical protein [Lachnospiraceae bacterium]
MNDADIHKYDDIINLPHHVSSTRPHMSIEERAAQFSPFAALTGHEDAIKETARQTEREIILDENELEILDEKLKAILSDKSDNKNIKVVYYVPDENKNGGKYVECSGRVKKMDEYRHVLVMEDGTEINVGRIVDIQ